MSKPASMAPDGTNPSTTPTPPPFTPVFPKISPSFITASAFIKTKTPPAP